jgi:hypothetical protein
VAQGDLALGDQRIRHDDAPCPLVARHGQHEETDGAAAHDHDSLVPERSGDAAGVHRCRERFDQRCGEVVQAVRNEVQSVRAHHELVGHASLGVSAPEELQPLAEVFLALAALLAVPARQGRLHGDAVADRAGGHVGSDLGDDASDLVPRVVGDGDERVATVQRVGVGAAHADRDAANANLVRRQADRRLDAQLDPVETRHQDSADVTHEWHPSRSGGSGGDRDAVGSSNTWAPALRVTWPAALRSGPMRRRRGSLE